MFCSLKCKMSSKHGPINEAANYERSPGTYNSDELPVILI
jgi:hypothetical protein